MEAVEKITTSGRESDGKLSKSENSTNEGIESSKIEDHQNNNLNESSNESSEKAENLKDKSSQESGTESQNTNDRQIIESDGEKVKMKINDSALFKFYQNIPGEYKILLGNQDVYNFIIFHPWLLLTSKGVQVGKPANEKYPEFKSVRIEKLIFNIIDYIFSSRDRTSFISGRSGLCCNMDERMCEKTRRHGWSTKSSALPMSSSR